MAQGAEDQGRELHNSGSLQMAARCFDLRDPPLPLRKAHGMQPTGLHFTPIGSERKTPGVRIDSLGGYGRELILEQVIRFVSFHLNPLLAIYGGGFPAHDADEECGNYTCRQDRWNHNSVAAIATN